MIKRIVDISEQAYIHIKHQQLVIDKEGGVVGKIPIEDLGMLILQHPAIVITQKVIIACQKNKVVIIFCDEKHLPYSVILPVSDGHTLHQKVMRIQVGAKKTHSKENLETNYSTENYGARKNTVSCGDRILYI